MIPKKLHYCWFGGNKKPHLIRKCIESWKREMPDFEIKEWNEDIFDVEALQFTKEAYYEQKWAFVSDVCRFHACLTEGGIYLDTDVEVLQNLSQFLNYPCFAGTEVRPGKKGLFTTVDASAFGCEKGNWFIHECLDWYKDKPFRMADGSISGGVVQVVATQILEKHGYKGENIEQDVAGVKIFPNSIFTNVSTPYDRKSIYTLHHFDGSWTDTSSRGHVFKFCRKHDLMHLYKAIEKFERLFK